MFEVNSFYWWTHPDNGGDSKSWDEPVMVTKNDSKSITFFFLSDFTITNWSIENLEKEKFYEVKESEALDYFTQKMINIQRKAEEEKTKIRRDMRACQTKIEQLRTK